MALVVMRDFVVTLVCSVLLGNFKSKSKSKSMSMSKSKSTSKSSLSLGYLGLGYLFSIMLASSSM